MTLRFKWGVVDLRGLPPHLVHTADPLVGEYARSLMLACGAGWGFLSGSGSPLGLVTVARLEVADGCS